MIKRELVLRLKENKKTNVEIAGYLGITKSSVTQYVQGKRASDSKKLRKIKKVDALIKNLAKELAGKKLSEKQITDRFCDICKAAQKATGVCA
ncbi:hypothetical protein ACFL0W_06240 [Nanoarchaeota archaeon]